MTIFNRPCHSEPQAKNPMKSKGFFAPLRMTSPQNGFSSIIVLLTLLSMVGMGGAIAYMTSVNQAGRGNHLNELKALYEAQAGTEYALKKVYEGEDGNINPINFGSGNFNSAVSGPLLVVTGNVGNSARVFKLKRPTQADCQIIDASGVNTHDHGKRIAAISFKKNCLPSLTIVSMMISWIPNGGEKMKKIRIESSTVYDNAAGVVSGTVVDTVDYSVNNGNNNVISRIEFGSSVVGKNMTLQFNLSDGSSKAVAFIVPASESDD